MFLGFEKEFGSLDCQTLPIKFFFYFPLLRGRYACRKKNVFLEALKILLLVTTLVTRKIVDWDFDENWCTSSPRGP